jgi:Cu/Ag efflux pump CusA
MVLAGLVIAVAAIVDDAILGVDGMLSRRRRRQEVTDDDGSSRTVEAAIECRGPMLYATQILLLAVVPVFVMEGGGTFGPLALSFVLGLRPRWSWRSP